MRSNFLFFEQYFTQVLFGSPSGLLRTMFGKSFLTHLSIFAKTKRWVKEETNVRYAGMAS
ncbi:MAG TPA: hypothetical protein VIJ75_08015 [Hanamia sp.]